MPRLTDHHYLTICHRLRALLLTTPDVFAFVTALEQWKLHDYFQPAQDLTDAQRLVHRREISARWPTLPQQAGRALAKLDEASTTWAMLRLHAPVPAASLTKGHGPIKVQGVVQPEVDAEALLRVLLDIANQPDDLEPPEPGHVEDHKAS
jgi:hypothetical protein